MKRVSFVWNSGSGGAVREKGTGGERITWTSLATLERDPAQSLPRQENGQRAQ